MYYIYLKHAIKQLFKGISDTYIAIFFISPETLPDIPLTPTRHVLRSPVAYTGGTTINNGSCNRSEPQHKKAWRKPWTSCES